MPLITVTKKVNEETSRCIGDTATKQLQYQSESASEMVQL